MLVIRLMRTGKKNQPFFRFVVTEKKNPSTAGRTTEILGFYNPLTKERKINRDRVKYWISVGAKPSDTVFNFLVSEKIIEGKKIPKHKKPPKEPPDGGPAGQAKKEPVAETTEIKQTQTTPEPAKPAEEKLIAPAASVMPDVVEKPETPPEMPVEPS